MLLSLASASPPSLLPVGMQGPHLPCLLRQTLHMACSFPSLFHICVLLFLASVVAGNPLSALPAIHSAMPASLLLLVAFTTCTNFHYCLCRHSTYLCHSSVGGILLACNMPFYLLPRRLLSTAPGSAARFFCASHCSPVLSVPRAPRVSGLPSAPSDRRAFQHARAGSPGRDERNSRTTAAAPARARRLYLRLLSATQPRRTAVGCISAWAGRRTPAMAPSRHAPCGTGHA